MYSECVYVHTEQLEKIIYVRIPLYLTFTIWVLGFLGGCNSYHLMRRRRVFQIRFRRLQRLPTKIPKRACQGSNDFPSRPARRRNGFAFNRLTCTSFSYARTYDTVIFSHMEYGELIRSTNHTNVYPYACIFVLYSLVLCSTIFRLGEYYINAISMSDTQSAAVSRISK